MSIHKWRKRRTKYFGETWVPFAQVDIQGADGKNHNIVLQIDSGAVVSLLRRSVANLLGLELESGRRVELSSVGGTRSVAFVHELRIQLDPNVTLAVPFAIAESERVPNLLGRQGLFDTLQIHFDSTFSETKISAPWLTPNQRRIWDGVVSTEKHILDRWNSLGFEDPTAEALKQLVRRGAQLFATAAGLLQLHRAYDGVILVRALFEHAAQAVYLLGDPCARAKQYLDFKHVTRHLMPKRLIDDSTGPISDWLEASPDREIGEEQNKKEFERVKSTFTKRNGKDLWDSWYCMTIADLAKKIGWMGEYRLWYAIGSGWSHGDPFFTQRNSSFEGFEHSAIFTACFVFYGRMLHAVSQNLVLTGEQAAFFKQVLKPLC